jgi:hypothetical protein
MKVFRRTAGTDHKRNEEILEELKVEPADKKLRRDANQIGFDMQQECKAAEWQK